MIRENFVPSGKKSEYLADLIAAIPRGKAWRYSDISGLEKGIRVAQSPAENIRILSLRIIVLFSLRIIKRRICVYRRRAVTMKIPIKMLVTDLDDTLLRTDKSVSERTKSVLRLCVDAGIKLVYATGRGDSAIKFIPFKIFSGKVVNNGAVAAVGDNVIYRRMVPYEAARPILIACDKRGLRVVSQCGDIDYANFNVSEMWSFIDSFEIVDFALHDKDAEKIYIDGCRPEDAAFIEAQLPENLYQIQSRDGFGQIMHREATKAKGVAALAQYWGISQSEILAFGDDMNDVDMLSYAGIGVAMENALDEVKAAADYTCQISDNDGLAEWILTNLSSL